MEREREPPSPERVIKREQGKENCPLKLGLKKNPSIKSQWCEPSQVVLFLGALEFCLQLDPLHPDIQGGKYEKIGFVTTGVLHIFVVPRDPIYQKTLKNTILQKIKLTAC